MTPRLHSHYDSPDFRRAYPTVASVLADNKTALSADELLAYKIEQRRMEDEKLRAAERVEVCRSVVAWSECRQRLESNTCSRFHKLIEASRVGEIIFAGRAKDDGHSLDLGSPHVFVVAHDWAAAFDGADAYEDGSEYRLPYEHCAFEMSISGRTCIYLTRQEGDRITVAVAV